MPWAAAATRAGGLHPVPQAPRQPLLHVCDYGIGEGQGGTAAALRHGPADADVQDGVAVVVCALRVSTAGQGGKEGKGRSKPGQRGWCI